MASDESMMDWNNPMAMFGLAQESHDDEVDDDDDENDDFYGDQPDAAHAAILSVGPALRAEQNNIHRQQTLRTQTPILLAAQSQADKDKIEKRTAELRAKLVAQRQNTPSKSVSRAGTPAKAAPPAETLSRPPPAPAAPLPTPVAAPTTQQSQPAKMQEKTQEPVMAAPKSSDTESLEALLSQGQALANAQTAALAADTTKSVPAETNGQKTKPKELIKHEDNNTLPPTDLLAKPTRHATNLSDSYYADLPAWLEMTGYHDAEYRNSKLRTYKERVELEKEAARIADRLEKLRQAEQENIQALRMSTPMPVNMAPPPPPLPVTMPGEKSTPQVNGTKRPRSPESLPPEKARRGEDSGFRIRGATDSPDTRPNTGRRPHTPSPADLERRISYPDARRRSSIDGYKARSRDPSLERRQNYYRNKARNDERHDHYTPQESPRTAYPNTSRHNSFSRSSQYRGSAGLDLRKGGIAYYMIKSWNHENVLAAQRDNIWATQEKNEQMLTDAFNTHRHVILLFSVNKSVAFQGYALMTSPPDPKLPKPAFCSRLNWGTSPAFTLRWLGTTPIHFRLIGNIKNTLNIDEKGEPRAVLVGKDGQEISPDAGMGVVWALDEAEAKEKDGGGDR